MNNKTVFRFVFALLALIGVGAAVTLVLSLGAGSLLVITSSSGRQPTPVESYDSVPAGYQPITVDQVEVEVGVGSPIPVHVIVSGSMPDPCSQVEYTEIKQDGSNFIITLSATPYVGGPAVDGCIKDPMYFKMGIPLNVVGLPAGSYSVTVNGSRADFKLDTANSTSPLWTADMPFNKADIQVDAVNIDIGRGSPPSIHAIVSANLSNACARLGEVRVHRDETTFFVRLVAYIPAQTDCNPDTLPMHIEVPLNIVYAPEGPYVVNVNGVTASFDHRVAQGETSQPPVPATWVTYNSANQQCGYAISYPPEIQITEQTPYSQTLGFKLPGLDAGIPNFIYMSVVTPEIQKMVEDGTYNHDVYNYDPAASEILENMQTGESKSVHQTPGMETGFTFERKLDTQISSHVAQTYENIHPWEFPDGTKEIRYHLLSGGCIYLFGGYVNTTQSNQPGVIMENLFDQIIATVQVMP
jgi:hypothetical protein